MNFDFTDDQQAIKRTANEFLGSRFKPEKRRELAEAGTYDDSLWAEIAELGWPGIFIDEEHGGQGLGVVELVILQEELGYALAPTPFFSNAAAGFVIQQAGSDEQKQKFLPGIASGEERGTVGIVSNGEAVLVPDADSAALIVLVDGDSATVVEAGSAEIEQRNTIDSTRRFSTVRANGGEALAGDVQAGLDRAEIALAAELVGIAQWGMEQAVAYAKDRKQFDRPIGSYQAVAHRCAQMMLEVESSRSAVYYSGWVADNEPETVVARRLDGQGLRGRRRLARDRLVAAGARRYRLHLGARPPLLPQARPHRRSPARQPARTPRPRGRAGRPLARGRHRLALSKDCLPGGDRSP